MQTSVTQNYLKMVHSGTFKYITVVFVLFSGNVALRLLFEITFENSYRGHELVR